MGRFKKKKQKNYYISDGTWFDEGSLVKLIDDYRPQLDSGLFEGLRDGKMDQEICGFDEMKPFEVFEWER